MFVSIIICKVHFSCLKYFFFTKLLGTFHKCRNTFGRDQIIHKFAILHCEPRTKADNILPMTAPRKAHYQIAAP